MTIVTFLTVSGQPVRLLAEGSRAEQIHSPSARTSRRLSKRKNKAASHSSPKYPLYTANYIPSTSNRQVYTHKKHKFIFLALPIY